MSSSLTPDRSAHPPLWARSVLFFPGHRPELAPKAIAAGPDSICIDLEDAVPAGMKDAGRTGALGLLAEARPPSPALLLRINPAGTPAGEADLAALGTLPRSSWPAAVVLPKIRSAAELLAVAARIPAELPLIPLIETAEGLYRVEEIALSTPRLAALLIGGVDLSADLGCTMDWDSLLYARGRVVHAGALARIPVIDVPWRDLHDLEGLRVEAARAARLGLTGKIAIHPGQIAPIHEGFTPSFDELASARRIVAAWDEAGGGALQVDGALVEEPVVRRALRTVALHAAQAQGQSAGGEA
jgi:(S)-citramalyl-CoA lyase